MIRLKNLWSEDFIIQLNHEDRQSLAKILSVIVPILLYVVYWDFAQLGAKATLAYILIKTITIGFFILAAILTYFNKALNYWPIVTSLILFTYSYYGMLAIDFTYCYSFWEIYFGVSFFFRSSKKAYLIIMSYGMILNLIALKLVSEPDFIKIGYSFKPHMITVTVIIFILTNLLYYTVTKKREELYALQEKFASIGKQSSYIFHEIKKPINRLLSSDSIVSNDIRQIKNILMNIDLLLKNPDNFKESFTEFNLRTILEIIEMDYAEYFEEYSIKYEYPATDLEVTANKDLFQQVFKNLTINAIEAIIATNDLQNISKMIKISYEKSNDGKILISFKNTGSKIPSEISDKIFSAFYTTKKSSTNNGLGLSFCKTIVEAHNGKIILSNHKNGPEFTITI